MKIEMKRRASIAVGGLAITALLVTGCTSSDPAEPSVETDPNAVLSVGARILPANWDPKDNPAPAGDGVLKLVYETLVDLDPTLQLEPGLAESWTVSDDGLSWDFKLLKGVVFSDGSTFDAEDAKASLDNYRGETSLVRAELLTVKDVVVVDEYTLQINLVQPNYGLPAVLTGRSGMMLSADAIAADDYTVPIGTGPYVLDAQEPAVKFTYSKNKDYRDADSVLLAGVVIQAFEDPVAMANALTSGEIDMATLDPTQVAPVTAAGIPTWNIRSSQLVTVVLNPTLEPAFADPRVRLALSMAMDREGIVASTMFGLGEPASQFILSGKPGYDDGLDPIPYDADAAKDLLEEAGYGDGLTFRFIAQANNKGIAEALQANWAEIGVDVQLEFPPGLGAGEALFFNKTAPAGIYNGQVEANVTSYLNRMLSPKAPTNPGAVEDPEVTALLQAITAEPDEAKREALIEKIQGIVIDNPLGHLPIAFRFQTIGYSSDLVGIQEWQGIYPVLDGIGVAAK